MSYIDNIRQHAQHPLSHQLLVSLLSSYEQPNDKIRALIKDGSIQSLKKGLYIAGPELSAARTPEPFLIANHLLGPSYVSCETALAYYDLIPERVYETTSMTIKSSRKFITPVGTFSYLKLPLPYYSFGIKQIKLSVDEYALVASPEKALCDKIITTSGVQFRSKKSVKEFLIENMRMDEVRLRAFNVAEISTWLRDSAKMQSLQMLVDVINEI